MICVMLHQVARGGKTTWDHVCALINYAILNSADFTQESRNKVQMQNLKYVSIHLSIIQVSQVQSRSLQFSNQFSNQISN